MGAHSTEKAVNPYDVMFGNVTPQEALTARRDQALEGARDLANGVYYDGLTSLTKSGMLEEVSRDARENTITFQMPQGHWVTTSRGMARIDNFVMVPNGTPRLELTYATTVTYGSGADRQVYPDKNNSTSVRIAEYDGEMHVSGMNLVRGFGTPYNIDGRHEVSAENPQDSSSVRVATDALDNAALAVNEMVAQAEHMVGAFEPVAAGAHAA
jgi:hypothetical protein